MPSTSARLPSPPLFMDAIQFQVAATAEGIEPQQSYYTKIELPSHLAQLLPSHYLHVATSGHLYIGQKRPGRIQVETNGAAIYRHFMGNHLTSADSDHRMNQLSTGEVSKILDILSRNPNLASAPCEWTAIELGSIVDELRTLLLHTAQSGLTRQVRLNPMRLYRAEFYKEYPLGGCDPKEMAQDVHRAVAQTLGFSKMVQTFSRKNRKDGVLLRWEISVRNGPTRKRQHEAIELTSYDKGGYRMRLEIRYTNPSLCRGKVLPQLLDAAALRHTLSELVLDASERFLAIEEYLSSPPILPCKEDILSSLEAYGVREPHLRDEWILFAEALASDGVFDPARLAYEDGIKVDARALRYHIAHGAHGMLKKVPKAAMCGPAYNSPLYRLRPDWRERAEAYRARRANRRLRPLEQVHSPGASNFPSVA